MILAMMWPPFIGMRIGIRISILIYRIGMRILIRICMPILTLVPDTVNRYFEMKFFSSRGEVDMKRLVRASEGRYFELKLFFRYQDYFYARLISRAGEGLQIDSADILYRTMICINP